MRLSWLLQRCGPVGTGGGRRLRGRAWAGVLSWLLAATAGAAQDGPALTREYLDWFDSAKTTALLPDGERLAYLDTGRQGGPVVVLIHGYTDSARDWAPLAPLLAPAFRLIIVDLRGHGASGKPECCYTRFDFAYDIRLLLEQLHVRAAAVMGHSLGSLVAQSFAELWPQMTQRLVLISSTGTGFGTAPAGGGTTQAPDWLLEAMRLQDPIDPDSVFMRDWWHESVRLNPEFFSSRQRRDAAAIPAQVWQAVADQSLLGVDLASMLPRVRVPTLLIWGGRDTLISAAGRDTLRRGIANARVREFPELGHDLFWQEPGTLAKVISEFLQER